MLKATRYIFILSLGILLILASCGSKDDANKDNIPADGDNSQETTLNPLWGDSPIPATVNMNGRVVRVFNASTGSSFMLEEAPGEVVGDAQYKRNKIVEDKLNVKFQHLFAPEGVDANTSLMNTIQADLADYDIATHYQWDAVRLVTAGAYRDIGDLPYVDINDPWWATFYCEEMKIGNDRMFFYAGDWHYNTLNNQSAMFVNKKLYTNEIGDPNDLYQIVMDGKWTFDKYTDTVREMWKDLDGDGRKTAADQYGTAVTYPTITNHLTFAAGIKFSERDENGLPRMIITSEQNITFTEKMTGLYFKNDGCRCIDSSTDPDAIQTISNMFADDRLLIYVGRFWNTSGEWMRNMNTDYMIIPYPKYDESMPQYYSLVGDSCPLLCVPTTSTLDDSLVGAIFTELAYQAHEHMIPAYFEVALKGKYTRDTNDVAFEILDMIRAGATTDFAFIYNDALEGIGAFMHSLMRERTKIVSAYSKVENAVDAALQSLISAYLD